MHQVASQDILHNTFLTDETLNLSLSLSCDNKLHWDLFTATAPLFQPCH